MLYQQGHSTRAISRNLGIRRGDVVQYIAEARREWMAERRDAINDVMVDQLQKLDLLEQRAWDAMERSGTRAKITTTTDGPDGATISVKEFDQCEDPRYMAVIVQIIAKRCEILGINSAVKVEHTMAKRVVEVVVKTPEEVLTVEKLQERIANPGTS